MTFILTGGLIILLALGLPVGISLCVVGCLGYMVNMGSINSWFMLFSMPLKMNSSLTNFLLLSIPLFILAAKLMNGSSITKRIFDFANVTVGWLPGGLGHTNIFASLLFAGMSGTAVSDAAGLGQIEIKAMVDAGYDPDFSAAATAASSTIGPIFPPSVPMVMYSTISGVSVGSLFMGGVVPGVLMTLAMMVMVIVYARKKNYPRRPFPTFREFWDAFKLALVPLLTPVILLTGIWSGWFTTTEAAVVATVYALIISTLVYREMPFKLFVQILKETARDTASIGFVTAAAAFYGWVLARSGLNNTISEFLVSFTTNPVVFMFVVNIFLLIVGCFMESIAAIMVFGPVLLQASNAMGIDPLYFGLVMVLNLMIGLNTPPFGITLFISADIAGISFKRMVKAMLPFYVPLFGMLILLSVFPPVGTWLPSLLV